MLAQHPDIEKRLREEIFTFVGPTATPTYEHMREMKYMRAFFNGKISSGPLFTLQNVYSGIFRGSANVCACVRVGYSAPLY